MEPIQRSNVPQVIAERIIDLITRGELKLGEQLPSQRDLAKQLGVGVSSIRESLQSLTALGIIQMQPGRGTFARDGAKVVALDIPQAGDALAKVANEIGGTALQLDITAEDAGSRLAQHVAQRYGDAARI